MLNNHDSIRSLFPFTKKIIYLDAAHYAPYPRNVVDKINEFIAKFTSEYLNLSIYQIQLEKELKESAATLINADPDDIIITSNTTHGINIFANGISLPADNNAVAFIDSEFPSVVYPWLNQEKLGRVSTLLIPSKNGYANEAVLKRILLEYNVQVFTLSYVQFLGYRYNIRNITEFCKRNNILLLVDAIQATGICPIDVQEMGIDYLCTGCPKWLMSPAGTGFTYISKKYKELIRPTYVGTTSINYDFDNFLDYKLDFRGDGGAYENSTLNILGMLGLDEVIRFFMELGVDNIFRHILDVQDLFMSCLDKNKFRIESDLSDEHRSNILLFSNVDQTKNKAIQTALESKNIYTALREGFLRISPHIYNNYEDIEILASELNKS